MALIKCPECGKEISDKAISCPNCGNPMNSQSVKVAEVEKSEAYLCCPHCGSREIHAEKKGYSGGKALAGFFVTGSIGLLAGTISSRDVDVTCLACGKKTKAGELKTVYTGNYKKEFDSKLRELMCDIMALEDAHKLFLTQYGVTEEDWKKYNDNFNKEIEENKLSPEEREKLNGSINKFNNSGCMVLLITIVILSSLIVSFV